MGVTVDLDEVRKGSRRRAAKSKVSTKSRETIRAKAARAPELPNSHGLSLQMRKAENKNARIVNLLKLIVVSVFLLALVPTFARMMTKPYLLVAMRTVQARSGALESGVYSPSILIRDETIVMSPISGRLKLMIAEGDRVRRGAHILEVRRQPGESRADEALAVLEDELRTKKITQSQRIESLQRAITEAEVDVDAVKAHLSKSGDEVQTKPKTRAKARIELKTAIERLQSATQSLEDYRESSEYEVNRLEQRLIEMRGAMKHERFSYTAAESGVVSFRSDGYEGSITAGVSDAWLSKALEAAFADEEADRPTLTEARDGQEVKAGNPVVRLINNFKVYVAVLMPITQARTFESGVVKVSFDSIGRRLFKAKIHKVLPATSGDDSVVVFEVAAYIDAFSYMRFDKARVLSEYKEGIIVPASALVRRPRDGAMGVFIAKGMDPVFHRVDVASTDGESCVVSGLPEGTRVVRNPGILPERYRRM